MRHSTTRKRSLVLLAVGLLIALGACSDDDEDDDAGDAATTTEAPDDATTEVPADDTGVPGGVGALVIEDFAFSDVVAEAGATVTVNNADGAPHTVTSDDDAWELVRVDGGSQGELTAPDEAGEYAFHCDIHPTMTGTLVVE